METNVTEPRGTNMTAEDDNVAIKTMEEIDGKEPEDESRDDTKAETRDELWNVSQDELRKEQKSQETRDEKSQETSLLRCILERFNKMSPPEQKSGKRST